MQRTSFDFDVITGPSTKTPSPKPNAVANKHTPAASHDEAATSPTPREASTTAS
jgi:hypothetical protein